jgi:hypothetical protein
MARLVGKCSWFLPAFDFLIFIVENFSGIKRNLISN